MTTKSYYNRGEAAELHKRFCGERLVMCGGVGLLRVEVVEHVEGSEEYREFTN